MLPRISMLKQRMNGTPGIVKKGSIAGLFDTG